MNNQHEASEIVETPDAISVRLPIPGTKFFRTVTVRSDGTITLPPTDGIVSVDVAKEYARLIFKATQLAQERWGDARRQMNISSASTPLRK